MHTIPSFSHAMLAHFQDAWGLLNLMPAQAGYHRFEDKPVLMWTFTPDTVTVTHDHTVRALPSPTRHEQVAFRADLNALGQRWHQTLTDAGILDTGLRTLTITLCEGMDHPSAQVSTAGNILVRITPTAQRLLDTFTHIQGLFDALKGLPFPYDQPLRTYRLEGGATDIFAPDPRSALWLLYARDHLRDFRHVRQSPTATLPTLTLYERIAPEVLADAQTSLALHPLSLHRNA